MLIVLSPAKRLDFTEADPGLPASERRFREDTASLARTARGRSVAELRQLMGISDDLARLNRARFQAFNAESTDGVQAAFAFAGDVYEGLRARELDADALAWAQERLRILSGLYGLLRPLDRIQPYRLEMGTRLKTRRGSSLYDFWGDRLSKCLNADGGGHEDPTLVNLASHEYFGAVDARALKLPVLGCSFKDEKDGEPRVVAFYAKKARGEMARFAIDRRIDRAEGLKDFRGMGYRFSKRLSSPGEWVFTRKQPG